MIICHSEPGTGRKRSTGEESLQRFSVDINLFISIIFFAWLVISKQKGIPMQGPSISSPPKPSHTLRILGTPLEIAPGFIINLFAIWTVMSWYMGVKHPHWDWPVRIFAAGLSGFVLIAADVGHALAHSISARAAGAPMDKIDLTSGMPRTVYYDQAVPPRTHILRALGGPLYSALGLVLSLVARSLLPRDSAAREVAGWSSIGHGLIFAGSLAPLPIVDGGSILKWTLVESGKAPQEADQVVEQAGIAAGLVAGAAGAAFAARRRWLPAAGLLAAGVIAVAAARGKIR